MQYYVIPTSPAPRLPDYQTSYRSYHYPLWEGRGDTYLHHMLGGRSMESATAKTLDGQEKND